MYVAIVNKSSPAATAGLCECGCGSPTWIATYDHPDRGWVKGKPVRFVRGHGQRGSRNKRWMGDDASYNAVHLYLARSFLKSGVCEMCGAAGKTHHALIHGHRYSRNREDYRELCASCHNAYDSPTRLRGECNNKAKLTEGKVRDIRCRYADGESQAALAREYGVTQAAIWAVISKKTWRHVEGSEVCTSRS